MKSKMWACLGILCLILVILMSSSAASSQSAATASAVNSIEVAAEMDHANPPVNPCAHQSQ